MDGAPVPCPYPCPILDILDRRKAVPTATIAPAREMLVRVVTMLARLAST
jgi:hypothetical protein